MSRQFRRRFRVGRRAVEEWLRCFVANYPGYRDFEWNEGRASIKGVLGEGRGLQAVESFLIFFISQKGALPTR